MLNIISTGNEEIARPFGGGIPSPSLVFIAGAHGTGKSAISAQIMNGLLTTKKSLLCVIENTVKQHIQKVLNISKDLAEAANLLEIDPATLWRKRKKYNL